MSIALRGVATPVQFSPAAGASSNIVVPAGVATGDLLILHIGIGIISSTFSVPTGWTQLATVNSTSMTTVIFYKIASGTDATTNVGFVSSTAAAARWSGVMLAYSGVDNTTPFDVASQLVGGAASTNKVAPTTAVAVTTAGRVVEIVADKGSPGSPSFTQPAGYTVETSIFPTGGGATSIAAGSRGTGSTAGTAVGGETWTGSSFQYTAATMLLRPSVGGGASTATVHHTVWEPRASGAEFVTKVAGGTSVKLKVSAATDLSSPIYTSAQAPDSDGYVRHTATGLAAGTRYYYGYTDTPSGGTETAIGTTGRCKALPGTGNFAVAFGGCVTTNNTDGAALTDLAAWAPDFMLHLGDFHYKSLTTETTAAHLQGYEDQIVGAGSGAYVTMHRDTGTFYIRSDHEAGPDNGDSDTTDAPWMPYSALAVQKFFPIGSLADSLSPRHGLYRSWVVGGVRFIMLDIRTIDRSPGGNADGAGKTMLGATQLAWLKAQLILTEPFKVIVTDTAWMGPNETLPPVKGDWWPNYDTERQAIISYIAANTAVVGHVELWHSDTHSLAEASSSKNTWGGFQVLCAAPFANDGGGRDLSTFSSSWGNGLTNVRAYGRVTFTDDGTTITRSFVGWDAAAATPRITQSIAVVRPGGTYPAGLYFLRSDGTLVPAAAS